MREIQVKIIIPEGSHCFEMENNIIKMGTVCHFYESSFCKIFKEYLKGDYTTKDMKCDKCQSMVAL